MNLLTFLYKYKYISTAWNHLRTCVIARAIKLSLMYFFLTRRQMLGDGDTVALPSLAVYHKPWFYHAVRH